MKAFVYFIFGIFSISFCIEDVYGQIENYELLIKISKRKAKSVLNDIAFINNYGDTIIPFNKYQYAFPDTIREIGFVSDLGEWKAIDNSGMELFNVFINSEGPDMAFEGLFRILDSEGKFGFANMKGQIIINTQFDYVTRFHEGYASFYVNCKVDSFERRTSIDPSKKIKVGLIDKTGRVIVTPIYDYISFFKNGKARVSINNKKFYIDNTGKVIN
ncbi:WG repeat-containing protein [Sphingobacterium endophyticum]|uniref:WG repeat-containing protein n=1 Tax=Sphingobacterium endophyticum TaxID=2546448 RepID=UPI0012E287CC|nr:WG repeat-containing protein [Sphingobacterium endophyticum]